jgi:hypothetical protein
MMSEDYNNPGNFIPMLAMIPPGNPSLVATFVIKVILEPT